MVQQYIIVYFMKMKGLVDIFSFYMELHVRKQKDQGPDSLNVIRNKIGLNYLTLFSRIKIQIFEL